MELIKTITETYTIAKSERVESNCLAILFFIPSTSNRATINGVPVAAGDSLQIEQSYGYIDTTWYDVVFSAGAGANELVVSRVLIR